MLEKDFWVGVWHTMSSTSPVALLIFAVLGWVVTGDLVFVTFLIGLVINEILNFVLKQIFGALFAAQCFVYRPAKSPKGACGYWTKCSSEDPTIGFCRYVSMPSSQSQAMAFAVTFWLLRSIDLSNYSTSKEIYSYALRGVVLVLLLIMVVMSRLIVGCDTLAQVLVGVGFGVGIGAGVYFIARSISPEAAGLPDGFDQPGIIIVPT